MIPILSPLAVDWLHLREGLAGSAGSGFLIRESFFLFFSWIFPCVHKRIGLSSIHLSSYLLMPGQCP